MGAPHVSVECLTSMWRARARTFCVYVAIHSRSIFAMRENAEYRTRLHDTTFVCAEFAGSVCGNVCRQRQCGSGGGGGGGVGRMVAWPTWPHMTGPGDLCVRIRARALSHGEARQHSVLNLRMVYSIQTHTPLFVLYCIVCCWGGVEGLLCSRYVLCWGWKIFAEVHNAKKHGSQFLRCCRCRQ